MWPSMRWRAIESILTGRNEFHGMSEWWIQTVFLSQELWKVLRVFHLDLLHSSLDSAAASGFWRAFANILCCAMTKASEDSSGGGGTKVTCSYCKDHDPRIVIGKRDAFLSSWIFTNRVVPVGQRKNGAATFEREGGASGGGAVTSLPVCDRR